VTAELAAGVHSEAEEATEVPVKTRRSKQGLQQTLVSLLPQSKTGQVAAVAKLSSKKRSHVDDTAKSVGLADTLRRTRSKSAVAA